ncbi:dihydrofolate reductase family protein [Ruegeria atlantica]|uniref:dihydrofolate reductase family protein n=1 Tax=Ruegeria atlantica TaxID=81569 RepID=UPI0014801D79|nr:dihydrofolate reductase family protein [Ruegeria atlantica]
MHPIIYDVAVSLDGFISGPSGDVSLFAHEGPVVEDYNTRLASYATAIMGRSTYEFGYSFGLKPGQNPYPHMETIVFSQSIGDLKDSEVSLCRSATVGVVEKLKATAEGPIYLCGGGLFAGWLLNKGLINRIVLKRAPFVYGNGVSLFGGATAPRQFRKIASKAYDNGYALEEFET